jgi:hypothetical protein
MPGVEKSPPLIWPLETKFLGQLILFKNNQFLTTIKQKANKSPQTIPPFLFFLKKCEFAKTKIDF